MTRDGQTASRRKRFDIICHRMSRRRVGQNVKSANQNVVDFGIAILRLGVEDDNGVVLHQRHSENRQIRLLESIHQLLDITRLTNEVQKFFDHKTKVLTSAVLQEAKKMARQLGSGLIGEA